MQGGWKEKAFVPCCFMGSARPLYTVSLLDQYCPPAFPRDGDLGPEQPRAAGVSGWEVPSS